jgi:hypothetical protein
MSPQGINPGNRVVELAALVQSAALITGLSIAELMGRPPWSKPLGCGAVLGATAACLASLL